MKRGLWGLVGIGLALLSASLPAQAWHPRDGFVVKWTTCDEPAVTAIPSHCSTAIQATGMSLSIRSLVTTPNDGADFATDGDTAFTQISYLPAHIRLEPGASVDATAVLDVTRLHAEVGEALDHDGRSTARAFWGFNTDHAGRSASSCGAIVAGINRCTVRITNTSDSVRDIPVIADIFAVAGVEGWPLNSEYHSDGSEICIPDRIGYDSECLGYVPIPGVDAALEIVRGRAQISLDATLSFSNAPAPPLVR